MTEDQIKKAAFTHFANHGYTGASLAKIAADVGIKKQSIATYFNKKEEIFLSVFEWAVNHYLSSINQLHKRIQNETVERKLFLILYHSYQYKLNNREFTQFYHHAIHFTPSAVKEEVYCEIQNMERHTSAHYRAIFKQGIYENVIKDHPLDDLLANFYCLVDGMTLQMSLYKQSELEKRLYQIWNIFWEGIKS